MSAPEQDNRNDNGRGGEVLPFPERDGHTDDQRDQVLPASGGQGDGPAVLDAELVTDAELVEVPDAPAPVTPAWQAGAPVRHPVIAPWLADRGQRGQATRWALGFVRHWALFHLARLPIYVLKLVTYSPMGVARAVRGVGRWVSDAQAGPLRAAAVRDELFSEYDRLQSQRDLRFKLRLTVVVVTSAVGVAIIGMAAGRVPGWLVAAVTAGGGCRGGCYLWCCWCWCWAVAGARWIGRSR